MPEVTRGAGGFIEFAFLMVAGLENCLSSTKTLRQLVCDRAVGRTVIMKEMTNWILGRSYEVMLGYFRVLGMAVILSFMAGSLESQESWTRFRGNNADGVAENDPRYPMTWDKETNNKWVAEVPGLGWSCPVIIDGKVFVTSVTTDEENVKPKAGLYLGRGVRDPGKGIHHWKVFCFDLETGEKLWEDEPHTGKPIVPRHPKSTYAAETPTTDGERLFVLFGDLGLYCYDFEGNQLWKEMIDPKKTFFDYGSASSPVVHGNQVFVLYDNLEESWIASFDTFTGTQNWKTLRDEERSWATPFIWENELRTEIVVPGRTKNRSYSMEGKVLWEFDGEMSNLVIPSPFAAHGMCYIASGYFGDKHRPTYAIKPGASGDLTPKRKRGWADNPYIEWYQGTSAPYNTTQIIYGDYLYTLYDMGFLTCHNAKTGEEIYDKQRFAPRGSFTSSPWAYNGHIFCLSEKGLTYVVKAGPEFEVVATNDLDELCIATPGLTDGNLVIRTSSKLYCLTNAEKKKSSTADFTPIKKAIHEAIVDGKAAGASHLVVKDGSPVFSHVEGMRDIEDALPFEDDTVVRIYSMTKPITSVAAMILFEEGKFQLDDPVSKFIPSFANSTVMERDGDSYKVVPPRRPISVRDVFRHTTGYAYGGGQIPGLEEKYREHGMKYYGPRATFPPKMSIEQGADALAAIPAHHHPGERFTYGFSTDLLGRLVEVWSGKALDTYLQEAIFDKLGMEDTGFVVDADLKGRFASCHTLIDGKLGILDKNKTSPYLKGFPFLSGGGGLVSTMGDYSKFCQILVHDGGGIIKPETLEIMFTDQLGEIPGNFKFGLGFAIGEETIGSGDNSRKVTRYSWGGYASTDFHVVPDENLYQIFLRQRVPSAHGLAQNLFKQVYGLIEATSDNSATAAISGGTSSQKPLDSIQ